MNLLLIFSDYIYEKHVLGGGFMNEEQKLIKKAINGHDKAFEKLMSNYLQDIYLYIK